MNLVDHVLRRMGGRATALLPLSLVLGLLFQNVAAAARPLVLPLAIVLLMLALARTDWPRVRALLARPGLSIALAEALAEAGRDHHCRAVLLTGAGRGLSITQRTAKKLSPAPAVAGWSAVVRLVAST